MKFTLKKQPAELKIDAGGVPRVDLLPREIVAKRAQRDLMKTWGVRTLLAILVLVVAVAGMLAWQGVTAMRLANAQTQGLNLLTEIGAKAEIQELVNAEVHLDGFTKEALATDLPWVESVGKILEKFPEGASLCAYALTSGAAPSGDPSLQVGLSGTFVICGPFPSAIPYLRDATSVAGVMHATVLQGEYDPTLNTYAHTIYVEFDQSVYVSVAEEDAE